MKCFTRFVPYELAESLSKAGFDEATLTMYGPGGEFCFGGEKAIPAPTFAEAMDWFLEKGICISIMCSRNQNYLALVQSIENGHCYNRYDITPNRHEHDDIYSAILDGCSFAATMLIG